MTLNLITALMITIIAFVVYFALYKKFKREGILKPPSELKKKITNVFIFTTFGIGGIIIVIILVIGWNPINGHDISGWVTLAISTGIGIGIAISIGIYTTQSQKKTDELIKEIHGYIRQQKSKETLLQADYARQLLGLINFARMKVHGMNAQIKFLKIAMNQKFSMERINEEKSRREGVRRYQQELQELMIKSSIDQETLLELFGENVQILYNNMWKMFCWNDSLMAMGEDVFESFMDFINTGVKFSEELHDALIKYIPENQRKNFRLLSVEVE